MGKWILCATLFYAFGLSAQVNAFAPTLAAERTQLEQNLRQKIKQAIIQPLEPSTEAAWLEALWAMELMQIKDKEIEAALANKVLQRYGQLSLEAKRQSLEAIYCLYPTGFQDAIRGLWEQERNPKLFAMMTHYLQRTDGSKKIQQKAQALLRKNLAADADHPIVHCLQKDLESTRAQRTAKRPPLQDLLQHSFPAQAWVLFSFQRTNRDFPGLTLIRQPNGQFVREANGQLFHIPHLARAVSNLPGYLTHGNSPQGVLSILELTTTDNIYIGPSAMLNMVLPYEVPLAQYHHQVAVGSSEEEAYRNLLPSSWQTYFPIWEAYYAGKAGRTEIFAHGTTINPQFYTGTPYFPNTPSLGCLTASEVWNSQTGQLEKSDQQRLIQRMQKLGIQRGYFVVVETDAKKKAISVAEVEKWVKGQ
jgi:hypothetical protein